jgi:hypothetical protein
MQFELGLYRFFHWITQYQLTIALSTGRNPTNIAEIRAELASLARHIDHLEINNARQ